MSALSPTYICHNLHKIVIHHRIAEKQSQHTDIGKNKHTVSADKRRQADFLRIFCRFVCTLFLPLRRFSLLSSLLFFGPLHSDARLFACASFNALVLSN